MLTAGEHEINYQIWRQKVLAGDALHNLAVYRSGPWIPAAPVIDVWPVTWEMRNAAIPAAAIEAGHAFAVVDSHKAVSWAFCQPPVKEPAGVLWVAVQTLQAHRRKGYALATLIALRNSVEMQHTLVYVHAPDNLASAELAQAAGFVREWIWKDESY